jgi:hypothetical protein
MLSPPDSENWQDDGEERKLDKRVPGWEEITKKYNTIIYING